MWKVDPQTWQTGEKKIQGKRKKLTESLMKTDTYVKCQSGVSCLSWSSPESLFAGCTDHQLKVFDMNKLQVVESIFTNHKVVTCVDSTQRDLAVVLGGHEDGTVRLYD